MRPFDLMTWASIVILVVGSSLIFIWFLRDAGSVLRGSGGEPDSTEDGDPEGRGEDTSKP